MFIAYVRICMNSCHPILPPPPPTQKGKTHLTSTSNYYMPLVAAVKINECSSFENEKESTLKVLCLSGKM